MLMYHRLQLGGAYNGVVKSRMLFRDVQLRNARDNILFLTFASIGVSYYGYTLRRVNTMAGDIL